jgi:peptidoglycan/LPS O-acetylase OafA/YrhL
LGLFALYFALFYFHEGVSPSMIDLIWVFGNVFFIVGLFRWMAADTLPKSQVFEWMGRQSMGIYLWHVLPLLLVKDFVGTRQLDVFYPVVFVSELILLALIFLLWKYWRGAKLLLGGG